MYYYPYTYHTIPTYQINPIFDNRFPGPGGGGPPGPITGPGGPGGPGGHVGPSGGPAGPPPQKIPPKPHKSHSSGGYGFYAADVNVIQPCLYKYTYIWLNNGNSFWFFPVNLGSQSIGGYYWNANLNHWGYYALDTKYIDVVNCI